MFLSGIRRQQKTATLLSLMVIGFCGLGLMGLFSADGVAGSAMRSRVYGFRNTDNKEAMQLVGKLGLKVTIDVHSSTVLVLTGDDAEELTRAYTLMEIADQKEPVVLKILAQIPDDRAEQVIDDIHSELKTLNVGTLLNPPAKSVAEPLLVDIYQGELIAVAAENQIEKIEKAYHNIQTQSQPSVLAVLPVAPEPNIKEAPAAAVEAVKSAEPNTATIEPQTEALPLQPITAEPNATALPEIPAIELNVLEVSSAAAEPNTAAPEAVKPEPNHAAEPSTQEDFISEELLKALAVEEKKAEAQKAAAEKAQPVQTVTAEASEPAKEITADEFKKIVAQLMKQAAEEEKKTAQTPAALAAAAGPNQPAVVQPVQEPVEKPETPKPEALKTESQEPKVVRAKTDARVKTEKAPADPNAKAKAEGAKAAVSKEEQELELTITLPEKVEIKQLIELVGKQLSLNYMYDETKIKGEVTLKVHDGKIKVRDCYTLLETVLRYKGFVMTRRGNLVTILPNAELNFSDPKIRTSEEPIEAGDVFINSIFELKHAKIANVQNILTNLNLGTKVIPIAESNSLIITDYAYRMEKIEQVIAIVDVPGVPKTYTYRKLEYMQASELIPRLQTLAAQMENLSITAGTSSMPTAMPAQPTRVDPRTGQPMPGGIPQPAVPQTAATQEQTVFLDADQRTNRVLMIGNEEQLKMVNDLIDSLDVRQYNLRYVKEYAIKNVDASEVINVLNELGLASVTPSAGSTQTGRQAATPARPVQPARPGQPQQQLQAQAAAAQGSTTPDQPSISIRPNTNSLLVNATSQQHEDIQLVIDHIDVEQKDQRTIQEYEIQNVDAREVVQTLGDLGIISKDSVSNITTSKSSMYDSQMSSRTGRSSRFGGQQSYQQPGMPAQEGVMEPSAVVSLPTAEGGTIRELITTEPQISILETTNALLIYATPRQHASVALVIAHVDRELSETTAPYVVYPLENQDPEELADTLTSLIEGTVKQARTTSAGGQQPGVGPTPMDNRIRTEQSGESNLPKREEERITIIPDVKSYSLIVYANKKNQQWIATLIKQLDQYRPQVLLDCTLVEITKDDQFTMDLNVISKKYGLTTPFKQLTNPITGNTSVTQTGGTALEGTFDSTAETPFSAFYGDNNIQVLLEMMDKKNYGRVLARPSVLVKDNEEGVIKSENVTYVAELTSNTINNGDTAPTTTENVTFKDYTAGITLTITPHISSEKIMQLEIELDRTDFLSGPTTTTIGTTTYPKPLNTTSSNVKTWSIVPSGATIILGGIETVDQSKTNKKVPLLGDIPIVGLLFRGINQTDSQSKLYIFVKANIVKPGDELTGQSDIERISQKKRRAFEEDEARFQGLDSVPGLKPNPLYPDKILEDDEYIQKLKEQQKEGNVVTVPLN